MPYLIKTGNSKQVTCKNCSSLIGYFVTDIITKPDKIYSRTLMNKWIVCPECGEWIFIGNYLMQSGEEGNWKEKLGSEEPKNYYSTYANY